MQGVSEKTHLRGGVAQKKKGCPAYPYRSAVENNLATGLCTAPVCTSEGYKIGKKRGTIQRTSARVLAGI